MYRNRREDLDCRFIAETLCLDETEVRRAVRSFFGAILRDAASLPFNDERRIYSHDLFGDYGRTWNIPSLGRLGPLYSRYLKWRGNEAKTLEQVDRKTCRKRHSRDEIEHIAGEILSGGSVSERRKMKQSEMFDRIWMVGRDGKKSARQAIPKNKE